MPEELIEIDDELRTEIYKYYETVNPDNFAQNLAAAKEAKRQFDEMRRAVESAPDARNGTAWRDDLLTVPVQLSPRLQWIKKQNVTTHHAPECEEPWCAFVGTMDDLSRECVRMEDDGRLVYADTEEDAIIKLAISQGWKLWNEQ